MAIEWPRIRLQVISLADATPLFAGALGQIAPSPGSGAEDITTFAEGWGKLPPVSRERRLSIVARLALGFMLALLLLGIFGAFGIFELIVFTLVFSILLVFAVRPAVRKFLTPKHRSEGV